jgi:hypothetical protein
MKTKSQFLALSFFLILFTITVHAQDDSFSELTLTKNFKGESVESTKKFSVNGNHNVLQFRLLGNVKSGSITITLIKPDGSKLKTIEIDATSDVVSYEQSWNLKSKTLPAELSGDWQIKIQTDKAEGSYRLSIYTKRENMPDFSALYKKDLKEKLEREKVKEYKNITKEE